MLFIVGAFSNYSNIIVIQTCWKYSWLKIQKSDETGGIGCGSLRRLYSITVAWFDRSSLHSWEVHTTKMEFDQSKGPSGNSRNLAIDLRDVARQEEGWTWLNRCRYRDSEYSKARTIPYMQTRQAEFLWAETNGRYWSQLIERDLQSNQLCWFL